MIDKFYKLAPNGKLELFGIDGMNHLFISALPMIVTISLFFYFNPIYLIPATFTMWLIMRIVWFVIEYVQEKKMLKADENRIDHSWKFWKWTKSRHVDMLYPLYGDSTLFGFTFVWLT